MDGVLGRMSKDFIQDKFSEDEIQQALSRGSDDYGVEVSYSPSQIKSGAFSLTSSYCGASYRMAEGPVLALGID